MFGEGGAFWVAGRVLGVQAGVCFVAFRCWLIFLGAAEMEVGVERSGILDFGCHNFEVS